MHHGTSLQKAWNRLYKSPERYEAVVEEVGEGVDGHAEEGRESVGAEDEAAGERPLGCTKHAAQAPCDGKLGGVADGEAYDESQSLVVGPTAMRVKNPQFVPEKRIDDSRHIARGICNPRIDAKDRFERENDREGDKRVAAADKHELGKLPQVAASVVRQSHIVPQALCGLAAFPLRTLLHLREMPAVA